MIKADALVEMACVEAASGRHDRAQRLLGANEAWYALTEEQVGCGGIQRRIR
jgi:hypothetical protein